MVGGKVCGGHGRASCGPGLANFAEEAARYPYLGMVLTGKEGREEKNAKGKLRREGNALVGKDGFSVKKYQERCLER